MADRRVAVTLPSLPVEILGQVASQLQPGSLRSLSQTSRALNAFVHEHGWREFVRTNFPTYDGRPLWRDAAHSLTRLSEAWDSRAVSTYSLIPRKEHKVTTLHYGDDDLLHHQNSAGGKVLYRTNAVPRTSRQRFTGQTMDFHPVVDVKERSTGGEWADLEETLAVGAGPEILIRIKHSKHDAGVRNGTSKTSNSFVDNLGHKFSWRSTRGQNHKDGFDDITALKLLSEHSEEEDGTAQRLLVGRANGTLENVVVPRIAASTEQLKTSVVESYNTLSQAVRYLDLSPRMIPGSQHFAVGLDNTEIAYYSISSAEPLSSIQVNFKDSSSGPSQTSRTTSKLRNWALRFLNAESLAVGGGISATSLHIYTVRPECITPEPMRKFSFGSSKDAVYSIAPLPDAPGSGSTGNVFVSGSYNGGVRLHDTRDRRPFVREFWDSTEVGNAVYSVLPMQSHLVLAGLSRHHKINLFDLRYGTAMQPSVLDTPIDTIAHSPNDQGATDFYTGSVAVGPITATHSSVYSLVSASPHSPTFYQCNEGRVAQWDLFCSTDATPDPVFAHLPATARLKPDFCREESFARLKMYHRRAGAPVDGRQTLFEQTMMGMEVSPSDRIQGLDRRWRYDPGRHT